MYTGKLPESILRRSVLGRLRPELSPQDRRYCGEDCALFSAGEEGIAVTAVCEVPGFERDPGKLAVAAANNLCAGGVATAALVIHAVLPPWYEESALRRDMDRIRAAAGEQGMEVLAGHTQVSSAVTRALYSATGIGAGSLGGRRLLCPGDDLVVTRWIALGGTEALAQTFETELKLRYPYRMIDQAKEFERLMPVAEDARAVGCLGPVAVHDLSQGGVFGALWEIAERAGVGLEADLRKLPVRQETIEICEYFDVNPYELYSAGALLVGTGHGERLVRELERRRIPAAVVGHVTSDGVRILKNGEDRRYLDRPQQDGWYRLAERRSRRPGRPPVPESGTSV